MKQSWQLAHTFRSSRRLPLLLPSATLACPPFSIHSSRPTSLLFGTRRIFHFVWIYLFHHPFIHLLSVCLHAYVFAHHRDSTIQTIIRCRIALDKIELDDVVCISFNYNSKTVQIFRTLAISLEFKANGHSQNYTHALVARIHAARLNHRNHWFTFHLSVSILMNACNALADCLTAWMDGWATLKWN